MKCFYINLDKAASRRLNIENNFLATKTGDWSLSRFPAINAEYVRKNKIAGNLSENEKGCFLSHKFVIQENIGSKTPILILEDDAIFGKSTCKALDNFIEMSAGQGWDILFTDVIVPQPETMIELINLRKKLYAKQQTQILNLASFIFAGATAYVLNPNSLGKIFNFLEKIKSLDIPYDLYLRKLIHEGQLKGFVTFPFVTSLSSESDSSQIQLDETALTDLVWNTFRKMIWMDRRIEDLKPVLEKINRDVCDAESQEFGIIISACISGKFSQK